jgi:hypothetical protein
MADGWNTGRSISSMESAGDFHLMDPALNAVQKA